MSSTDTCLAAARDSAGGTLDGVISWDGRTRKIVVDGKPFDASIAPDGQGWTGTLTLRSGVDLTVGAGTRDARTVHVALWKCPAESGVGAAVVADDSAPSSLKLIPLCDCGERGCAHSGTQLAATVDGLELLSLIGVLEGLTVTGSLRDNDATWQPLNRK